MAIVRTAHAGLTRFVLRIVPENGWFLDSSFTVMRPFRRPTRLLMREIWLVKLNEKTLRVWAGEDLHTWNIKRVVDRQAFEDLAETMRNLSKDTTR